MKKRIPKPIIEKHEGFLIVRDDLLEGGTKLRALTPLFELNRRKIKEWVYPSPTFGAAQLAIAIATQRLGLKSTVFVPERAEMHLYTAAAKEYGAKIVMVPMGFQSNLTAKAKAYTAEDPERLMVPFGGDLPYAMKGITRAAQSLNIAPKEVWTSLSSGTLSRGLQAAWPKAKFFGVVTGHKPTEAQRGRAELITAPEKFSQKAKSPPPYPSSPYYDSKVWQFMTVHGKKGALMWNVAA